MTVKISVLIPAAGQGERLGRGPKALLTLRGRPLIAWVADKALLLGGEVIIAAPPFAQEAIQRACPLARVITGGATRQESIALLAQAASGEFAVIQDVARPFATGELMRDVLAAAVESGVAGAFLMPDVPVAEIAAGWVMRDMPREGVGGFQAPQAFRTRLLVQLHEQALQAGWQTQSTLQLALRAGLPVRAVPGEKLNIKITTEEDWLLATCLAERLL